MSYCKSKDREKARFNAVREVLREGRSQAEVARRFGVYPSTISRWVKRFIRLQESHEASWRCDKASLCFCADLCVHITNQLDAFAFGEGFYVAEFALDLAGGGFGGADFIGGFLELRHDGAQ